MARPRLSIAGLLGSVVIAAVGFAALHNASPLWAGFVVLAAVALLALAVLGAVYRRGAKRAFWLGFDLFGAGYLFVAFDLLLGGPLPPSKWNPESMRYPLLTTLVLRRIDPLLGPKRGSAFRDSVLNQLFADSRERAIRRALERPIPMPFPQETPLEDILKYIKAATESPELPQGIPIHVDPNGLQEAEKTIMSFVTIDLDDLPLKTTLRLVLKQLDLVYTVEDGVLTITYIGAKDVEVADAFQRVGHALFLMLSGLLGGIAGMLFHAKRDISPQPR